MEVMDTLMKPKKMKNLKNYFIALLIVFVPLAIFIILKKNNNQLESLRLENSALTDSLIIKRLETGEQTAMINILQADRVQDLLKIKSKDSVINKLQVEVQRYKKEIKKGGSVTVVGNTTAVTGTTPLIPADTSQASIAPFSFTFSDKWIYLSGKGLNDSLDFDLKVKNEYTIAIGYEKKKPFVEITNHNPYTETSYLRTFEVKVPKASRFSLGIQAGYGITKNVLSPYFGLGGQYTILRF
jgi:hypothetical protein